ncbi:Tyrosine phosphatase type IVA 2 [Caligus rogercresseyi]|uniref:Tyrosine phosphatase type IVA 2 n=1 Tax=Caligus rogercresseyi TaxID=217165 RepID=A0A7T8HID5_CALRO|nr:Tyrosine phosphatase type IVA 2 [Caligus rogercresseyi]
MTGKVIRPAPAEIEYKNMRFLITEQPQDPTIQNYIKILKEHRVSHLISFPDGSPPTIEIIDKWLCLLNNEFSSSSESSSEAKCVGVHCVTGLGRAPVLVAVALVELGMKYEDAVELIRKKRRGAINSRQLEFLAKYKRRKYFLKGKKKCHIQ